MVSESQLAERVNHYVEHGATTKPRSVIHEHVDGAGFAYLPGELILAEEDRHLVERLLGKASQGRGKRSVPSGLGTVRLAAGLDPFDVAAELVSEGRRLASPHMVLTIAPHWSWGSANDPEPHKPLGRPRRVKTQTRVGVVDTGMFEPVPPGLGIGIYEPDRVDVRRPKGYVDWFGAGHGGFIAGVIDQHANGTVIDVYRGFAGASLIPSELAVIAAVDRALAGGATVINLSLGSYGAYGEPPVGLRHAMRRWLRQNKELLIVAAAGNDGLSDPWYPAGFAGDREFAKRVVSVGSGTAKFPSSFSNWGRWVNTWAPGERVHSHYPRAQRFRASDGTVKYFPDGFALWSGTSFAAPFALARILRHADTLGTTPFQAWLDLRSGGVVEFS